MQTNNENIQTKTCKPIPKHAYQTKTFTPSIVTFVNFRRFFIFHYIRHVAIRLKFPPTPAIAPSSFEKMQKGFKNIIDVDTILMQKAYMKADETQDYSWADIRKSNGSEDDNFTNISSDIGSDFGTNIGSNNTKSNGSDHDNCTDIGSNNTKSKGIDGDSTDIGSDNTKSKGIVNDKCADIGSDNTKSKGIGSDYTSSDYTREFEIDTLPMIIYDTCEIDAYIGSDHTKHNGSINDKCADIGSDNTKSNGIVHDKCAYSG